MKIRQTTHFIELTPDDGKRITNAEQTEIYEYSVYLSPLDLVENYIEIDEDLAIQILDDAAE